MVNGAFVCLFLRLDWGKNCVLRKNYVSQEKTISLDSWAVIRPSQRIVRTLTHRGHSHAHRQYVNTLSHGGSTWWAGEKPNVSTAVRAMSTARTKHRRKLQTCQVTVLLTQRQGAVTTKKSLASSELLFNSFTFLYLCWMEPFGITLLLKADVSREKSVNSREYCHQERPFLPPSLSLSHHRLPDRSCYTHKNKWEVLPQPSALSASPPCPRLED